MTHPCLHSSRLRRSARPPNGYGRLSGRLRSSTCRPPPGGRSSSSARACSRAARSRFEAPTTWSPGSRRTARARRHHLLVRQSWPGAGARRARSGRAGRRRDADDGASHQGRRRPRLRRRSDFRRHDIGLIAANAPKPKPRHAA